MSNNYDNNYDHWERLVGAVLRREHDRELALSASRESSFNSISSYSFRSELDDDQNPQLEADAVKLLRDRTQRGRGTKSSDKARQLATLDGIQINYFAPQGSSFLGNAGILGLGKAVKVLDRIGGSMTNLKFSGFTSGASSKRTKISILAFEVANTITKGVNIVQSLSDGNFQLLHKEVLHLEGVQKLVSTDMNELLRIAAADKREELDLFSREVTRFGDYCKDSRFNNLDRFFQFFSGLGSGAAIHIHGSPTLTRAKMTTKMTIQELTSLAQHTFELYLELHALDKFEQDYRRKAEQLDSLRLSRKGEGLVVLQNELKRLVQLLKKKRKLVRSLKMRSLWSKSLEEVVEKLVDVVILIHHCILESFGDNGLTSSGKTSTNKPEKLGFAGLSLHYANIITQIDDIASHPASFDPEMRDALYNGLPRNVKNALRSRLRITDTEEDLTVYQIKAEMEKTLQWLVPLATNTTKCICEVYVENVQHLSLEHQGFGRVGEWPNAGNELGKRIGIPNNLIRLQMLYHVDKQKVDSYILDLVAWLHHLVRLVRYDNNIEIHKVQFQSSDKSLLDKVVKGKNLTPGISKSQEFTTFKNQNNKVWALSRSTGSSPRRGLEHQKGNIWDILDGLDSTYFYQ